MKKRLDEVFVNITDGKHGDCQDDKGSGFYFVSCKDVKDGKIHVGGARQITKSDFEETHRRTRLEPGDIVITNSGTIGRMALVPKADYVERTTFQKSVAILKPSPEQNPKWLYYGLQGNKDRLVAFAGGTAQKNLLLRDLRAFELLVPSPASQRRIASILSAYDDLIENNQRRIRRLEDMAQLLYREWFVYYRFPGHEDAEFVDSELGPIPEGWDVEPVAALGIYQNGFAFNKDYWGTDGTPIIKIKELKAGGVGPDTPRYNGNDVPAKHHYTTGALLFSWSATLDAYIWSGGPAYNNQHIFLVHSREGLPKVFHYHALKQVMPEFQNMSLGATMQHIKRSALDQVKVVVPPPGLLADFEAQVGPIVALWINLDRHNQELRQGRDLLLPRLISGELDVSDRGDED